VIEGLLHPALVEASVAVRQDPLEVELCALGGVVRALAGDRVA
jgi:hypothetical protein